MRKTGRIIIALLCALCLVLPAAAGAAPDTRAVRTVVGRIEQGSFPLIGEMSLVPEDCSGYELLLPPDLPAGYPEEIIPGLPALETYGDSGMLRCPLDEETARRMMEYGYAASVGPDGAILRAVTGFARPFLAVQRGMSFTLMALSGSRGVPDADGALRDLLERKLLTSQDPAEGAIRWSPDGRYAFFNDTERWRSAGMELNDPYLLDTQAGDIFLLESSGFPKVPMRDTFRCVMNGSFSLDGKSFFWYCVSYAAGSMDGLYLMRYDLESGAQETVCELEAGAADFCEVSENRWLLLEASGPDVRLVRLALSPAGIEQTEEPLPAFCGSGSIAFLPAVRGNVMIAATPRPSGGTFLLPLSWDTPAASAAWYKIGGIHDGALHPVSEEDILAELEAAKLSNAVLSGRENIGTANVKHAAAITGTEDLMVTVFIRNPMPESWGGGFRDFSGQVLLNTDTLKTFPIDTGGFLDGLQDETVDGSFFLAKNYGWDAFGLYSVYELPETEFLAGETYVSPYGTFMCRSERDPLSFTSVTLKNTEFTAEIVIGEKDRYTIRFRAEKYPEPETVREAFAVPEMLTEDRWTAVTSAMGSRDKKKFCPLYSKCTPETLANREDREEIMASYPAAANETVYLLKADSKPPALSSAESALAAAGYTAEDLARDMEAVAVPRETNVSVVKGGSSQSFPVRFTFSIPDPGLYPGSSRILELLSLCDRIGRDVMAARAAAEPMPPESVILEKYSLDTVGFDVTLDRSEADESTLEFSLTAIPR